MQKLKFVIALFSLVINTSLQAQHSSSYKKVLSTDFNGELIQGSIDTLIAYIHNGHSVRVGWQMDFDNDQKPDIEHWIPAEFITILGGHVFNQIPSIYQQGPIAEIPQVQIYPKPTEWMGLIGTNGKLLNKFVSPEKQYEVKTWNVTTFWSVEI